MRRWRIGGLCAVVAMVVLALLAFGCASKEKDDHKKEGGGGRCAELVDGWLVNCGFTLQTDSGEDVDVPMALQDCIDHWPGFWDCMWGCYTSTLSCQDFGACGQGC